jgi:hypothetical protein
MITLSYAKFHDPNFTSAIRKIASYTEFEPKVAYAFKRIRDQISSEARSSQNDYMELVKQYADLKDDGSIKPREDSEGKEMPDTFQIDEEKKEVFTTAINTFHKKEFSIDKDPVPSEWVAGVGLTPDEIGAAKELFLDLED